MEIDYLKFKIEELQFALTQSEKLLDSTVTSFYRINDKSYNALILYTGILAYYFQHLGERMENWIIFLGTALSLAILVWNLMPANIQSTGVQPSFLLNEWYYVEAREPHREMLLSVIEANQKAIDHNKLEEAIRMNRYRYSAYVLLASICVAFFIWWRG